MQMQFITSSRLRRMMGVDAHDRLCLVHVFPEMELTERGRDVFRNGEWNWAVFTRTVRFSMTWLGDGILLDYSGYAGRNYLLVDFFEESGFNTLFSFHQYDQRLTFWALPGTTQATQTAVCDLLLKGVTEYTTTDRVKLLSGRYQPPYSACPFSGPALARFLTQSPDNLGVELRHFELNEEQCRALVTTNESGWDDFKIILNNCRLTEAGERVLLDGIRRNRGPTSLQSCRFNSQLLVEALRWNSRIKVFRCLFGGGFTVTDQDVLFLLRALAENLGIQELDLSHLSISDESWYVMCQSLANHPAIEYLDLRYTASSHDANSRPVRSASIYMLMSEARNTHRIQCLVEMLNVNTTMKNITLHQDQRDENLWQNEIEPRLEINKFRPRIVAVEKAQGTLRAPLFGRALHAVNDNDTFLYMMITGNVDLLGEPSP
jgi:hypothetical protein